MSKNIQNYIVDLLDRPNEPVFTPKGDKQVVFNVPDDYLEERFKGADISDRFGSSSRDRVPIKRITLPDLKLPQQLGKDKQFSLFVPQHRKCAERLIEIFMGMRTLEDFLSCAAFCRGNMNCQLFNYALSVAILHRPDTKDVDLPPLCSYFPDKFMEGRVLKEARETTNLNQSVNNLISTPIEIPLDYTATDMEDEHRVAYFREDLGINLHHWHWHLVYPFIGPQRIVAKDRRGELFYHMHHQIIARYNIERFCNRLARVERFSKWKDPIAEGYFPKLDSLTSSRVWAARPPNVRLQDINRPAEGLVVDIQTLERWRARILEAIHTGIVQDTQGNSIQLTEETGIDIIGNLMESSSLSVNKNLYGDLHNFGHVAMGLVHDPDNRHLETFSVMGDPATTMRDPLFYRWHGYIDEMFTEYKQTLPRYNDQQLNYNGVRVTKIEITSQNNPNNQFNTFWQQSETNLTRGLDFTPRGNVFARFTHLQHTPFQYRITVNNSGQGRRGTVRIFIGPKFDERGLPFAFAEQRNLMVELDRFVVDLKPNQDTIVRSSVDSSITIPFERTFRDLNAPQTAGGLEAFNFCGCGWPDHMLIPKGTIEGYQAVLFVMISNYDGDRVENPGQPEGQCNDASSFCGLRNAKFPDRRSMGFPFDRVPRDGADTLQQFLTPNMTIQDVTIKFTDRVVPPPSTLQTQRKQ